MLRTSFITHSHKGPEFFCNLHRDIDANTTLLKLLVSTVAALLTFTGMSINVLLDEDHYRTCQTVICSITILKVAKNEN